MVNQTGVSSALVQTAREELWAGLQASEFPEIGYEITYVCAFFPSLGKVFVSFIGF